MEEVMEDEEVLEQMMEEEVWERRWMKAKEG